MPPLDRVDDAPEEFHQAVASLEAPRLRPEVRITEIPAPRRLAPYAAAVSGTVHVEEEDAAFGRLILLYDPENTRDWPGRFRVVGYVGAELETEIAADPLIGQVSWSWLTEALNTHAADHHGLSGTVTRATTEGFGAKARQPVSTELELRASWSPTGVDMSGHMSAWLDLLCSVAGLPPADVTDITPRRSRSGG